MSKEDEMMAKRERDLGPGSIGPMVGAVEEVGGTNLDLEDPVLKGPKAMTKPASAEDLSVSSAKGPHTTVSTGTEDRLRRALRNMLDNTAPDATPRPVRQEAEAAVKG